MKKFIYLVTIVFSLFLTVPAQAGSVIFTEVKFNILDPPNTTITDFVLTYNTTNITDLTLISGPTTSFTTDGINTVHAVFNPLTIGDFKWTFSTTDAFPIARLGFDVSGESATITGADVNIRITPIPEPASAILLGLGVLGILLKRKK